MEKPSGLPPKPQVKILSGKSVPIIEARINHWLNNETADKQVVNVSLSPKGTRLYAVITFVPSSD